MSIQWGFIRIGRLVVFRDIFCYWGRSNGCLAKYLHAGPITFGWEHKQR